MYLHYILSLEDDQLLSRVFAAQCENPVPNDWCLKVKQDLIDFEINYNFEDIKHMKKEQFKKVVKKACKNKAFEYLLKEKEKVSGKMGILNYSSLEMQPYLVTREITSCKKKVLFKLRVRMDFVRNNFGDRSNCFVCNIEKDKSEHLIQCQKLKDDIKEIRENTDYQYSDLFSDNVQMQAGALMLFDKALKRRRQLKK